ncbi:MAG: NUDIX hydrolase [Muribaculaceae bacterium]|nr:NUDIX hydrolase [Muribaculaceae bacterium]
MNHPKGHTPNDRLTSDHNPELRFCYRYPHAAITADCVIFGFNGKALKILLIERGNEPFLGYWALPGGFMRMDETIEETAARELREETNLSNVFLDQFKVYSKVGRDPRERVVTVAFIALVKPDDYNVLAGDDAANAMWFDDDMLPPLAFDHNDIIREAREYLKEILLLKPVAFELLNKTFTISQLQTVYEVINRTSYDRRNFLRTAIDSDVISEVKDLNEAPSGRTGKLYTFNEEHFSKSDVPETDKCAIFPSGFSGFSCPNTSEREEKRSKEERKAPTKGLFGFFSKLSR